jgi:thiol:disulfide interchange protein DsbA
MRQLILAAVATLLLAASAYATPSSPANGVDYRTLKQAQPVQAVEQKVEVIEFFMYHCPACYAVEGALADWVKKNSDKVTFRRVHLNGGSEAESHLFVTLEALQLQDTLHDKVLASWHVDRQRLRSDADNLAWAEKNGIDKDKFLAAYNAFSIPSRIRALGRMGDSYEVDSTPTLIVDGKYLTTPNMINVANPALSRTQAVEATLQVLDNLVARARK